MQPCEISRPIIYYLIVIFLLIAGYRNVDAADNNNEVLAKAEELLQEKKYSEAVVLYEEILTRDPSFVSAYPGLIKCYAALGDPEGGAAFIELLYLEDPDNAGVNYGLGYALYRQKD
jgi:lipopolysaccharide biosynthesis regulator YciM